MMPKDALVELLGRVGALNGAALTVNTEELDGWPAAAVSALKSHNLLRKARPAISVVCHGCEQECSMPVHTLAQATAPARSFVVCDKRRDTNRVAIPAARLAQWRCDADAVCAFVAASLGLRPSVQQPGESGVLPIGMARGNKRIKMLCLRVQSPLALVVDAGAMPLADVVGFEDDHFTVDQRVVRQLVDAATTADPRHIPNTVRREASKMDTQAKYSVWQKEYRALKRRRPNMTDVWYSEQIAKSPAGGNRSASTIKKHMLL